jgi:outer membrane cobalamin receptor
MTRRLVWLAIFMIIGGTAFSQANTPATRVDIPAQPLVTALRQLAEQTGLQLAVETLITTGKTSAAVKGTLSSQDALEKLLKGTGLGYRFLDNHTVAVVAAEETTSLNSYSGDLQQISDTRTDFRLAQGNPGQPISESSDALRSKAQASTDSNEPVNRSAKTNETSLEEITVSSKRLEEEIPQELEKYGTRVDTITTAQITDGGYTDVAQALGTLAPGLYLNSKNGPFDYVDASFQGSRTEDILWLVDGVRINNRLYAGTTPLDTIPAGMIERVEVIEGGQALFYGTQAVAGAINIVTKAFSDKPDGAVSIAADSNTGRHADGYARDALGKNQFVVYLSSDKSEGFQPFRNQDYQPSGTDRRRPYEVLTLGLKYAYNFTDDIRISADEQHTDARLGYANPYLVASEFNDRTEDLLTMKLDAKFNDSIQLFIKPYYHWWTSYVTQDNNTIPPSNTLTILYDHDRWGYRDSGANVLTEIRPGGFLEYFAGYDLQDYTGSDASLVITQHTETTQALFGQIRTSNEFSTNLRLSTGFRYNRPSVGPTATVWTVNGQYDIGQHMYVRGDVGTTFRLPTTEELFANDPLDERGDPNLKPERGTNTTLALGGHVGAGETNVGWEFIGFYRELKNLIDYASFDATTSQSVFGNVPGTVRTRGGEFTLNAAVASWLSANMNFTYADARDSSTGEQISRVPKNLLKAGLDYHPQDHPWGSTITLNHFGTTYRTGLWDGTESYGNTTVVDASARYFIDPARRQRIDVTLQNLFDKTYATGLGSGTRDADGSFYTFWNLGVPRTLRISYTYGF